MPRERLDHIAGIASLWSPTFPPHVCLTLWPFRQKTLPLNREKQAPPRQDDRQNALAWEMTHFSNLQNSTLHHISALSPQPLALIYLDPPLFQPSNLTRFKLITPSLLLIPLLNPVPHPHHHVSPHHVTAGTPLQPRLLQHQHQRPLTLSSSAPKWRSTPSPNPYPCGQRCRAPSCPSCKCPYP